MATSTKRSAPKRQRTRKQGQNAPTVRPGTKTAALVEMLSKADGATLDELVQKTGWQPHSVRGAISGTLKKKLGLSVSSETEEGRGRVYRITDGV